ncbi:uncharacterized protein A1O9_12254 [Exophiala aquamarina CBS 119918]|uniref:Xylanolytic transcriptional activator regulatory domain-containing protein n=1 Tax=Exophiala aquamarina CBS 119918 TaxID=1182545 RepID=A0A072NUR3_9EURO|nr:uncharacterized protein A1O9_12254 [Exophiala aquamarina CBS 119918]KEF51619.1 hypothetical protein A1O9_12254 [Exophiala aquamarina CBS 119918]
MIPIHDGSHRSAPAVNAPQALDLPRDYIHDEINIDPSNAPAVADLGSMQQIPWSYDAQTSRAFTEGQDVEWMPDGFDLAPAIDFIFDTYPDLFPQAGVRDFDFQGPASHHVMHYVPDDGTQLNGSDPLCSTDTASSIDARTTSSYKSESLTESIHGGFNMTQLDPVEGKCIEIRALLSLSGRSAPERTTLSYVNRSNLIHCVGLYGRHFQPNLPIIHRSTFAIAETSPALLLALMLVGACYSKDTIPRTVVDKLAMHLSAWIGSQTHETEMGTPPLPTIQAGSILGYVIVSSRNQTVFRAAQYNLGRNISMAERAQIFDLKDPTIYDALSMDSFDWTRWREEETRRRVACRIFCQDMALCVFRRKSPSFSPLSFDAPIPCYDACWEASTKEECLYHLKTFPKQVLVSTALRQFADDAVGVAILEASSFGMFVLILSIHCLLFQSIHNSTESSSDVAPSPSAVTPPDQDPLSQVYNDFSGSFITTLADDLVLSHGSKAMQRINMLLNRWSQSWELRKNRDTTRENCSFSGDPLRFFWLAKLYIVLHFYRFALKNDSEFAVSTTGASSEHKRPAHLRIISWLSRFRERQVDPASPTWTDYYLCQFAEPSTVNESLL